MRSAAILTVIVLLCLGGVFAGIAARHPEEADLSGDDLPASLDPLYPPRADRPLHLMGMHKLNLFFSALPVDVMEEDLEGAKGTFEKFQAVYVEMRKMVPEWADRYPMGPVEKLGKELATGNRDKIMAAFGKVGETCHHCHVSTMVPVQQKFRWGNFHAVQVKDPVRKEATDYVPFKQQISSNMSGIVVDLMQGQTENARRQFEQFDARFQALKDSCRTCHDRESSRFIDEDVEDLVGRLRGALKEETVDPDKVGGLIRGIGGESCSGCHLVHVPAALAREKKD